MDPDQVNFVTSKKDKIFLRKKGKENSLNMAFDVAWFKADTLWHSDRLPNSRDEFNISFRFLFPRTDEPRISK